MAAAQKTAGAGGARAELSLQLARSVEAPAIARAAASGLCENLEISPSLRNTCVLLVSEVVSNAVLHSSAPRDAPILLTAAAAEDSVRIAVTDAGDPFTHQVAEPATPCGGYGLYLVDRTARRWGIDRVGGTSVWFELPRCA